MVFNWDFHRHRVCRASCEFLDSISNTAVLSIDECNPALYRYIAEMDEAQVMEGGGREGGREGRKEGRRVRMREEKPAHIYLCSFSDPPSAVELSTRLSDYM